MNLIHIESKTKATLHATMTPRVVATTDRLEGWKKWLTSTRFRFEPTGRNLEVLLQWDPSLQIKEPEKPEERLSPVHRPAYSPKTKPYIYQQEAADRMSRAPGLDFALWCDPGTGKTKMAIDRACEIWSSGAIDFVLIVAPKMVHEQWILKEIPLHCGYEYPSLYMWRPGPWNQLWEIQQGDPTLPAFYSISYSGIYTKRGREEIQKAASLYPFLLVLDESHFLKSHRAKRYSVIKEFAQHSNCKGRILLSGTPIAKTIEEAWAQLKIMNEDILGSRYVSTFRNEYCVMGGRDGREFIRPRNLEKYHNRTRPYVFNLRKDELEGLPDKVYSTFLFELTPKQKKMYKDMANRLMLEIDSGEIATAQNAMTKITRLQQISNGFVNIETDSGEYETRRIFKNLKSNPRVVALQSIVDTHESLQMIVWCRFQEDVRSLYEFFSGISCTFFGPMNSFQRERALTSWLSKKKRLLIATTETGGTGLNLHTSGCSMAVYYSNTEKSIQRWQSEDRIHRIGAQTRKVSYIDLVARGSRDMRILANLQRKKEIADMSLTDIYAELQAIEF